MYLSGRLCSSDYRASLVQNPRHFQQARFARAGRTERLDDQVARASKCLLRASSACIGRRFLAGQIASASHMAAQDATRRRLDIRSRGAPAGPDTLMLLLRVSLAS